MVRGEEERRALYAEVVPRRRRTRTENVEANTITPYPLCQRESVLGAVGKGSGMS
jgi:hypothetical protein